MHFLLECIYVLKSKSKTLPNQLFRKFRVCFYQLNMKNKDVINSISAMIEETITKQNSSDNLQNDDLDISYDEGIKYFGSMMERILNSIDKIESNFKKIKDIN